MIWFWENIEQHIFFPFSLHCRLFKNKPPKTDGEEDGSQAGVNKAIKGGIIYGDYLQVKNK